MLFWWIYSTMLQLKHPSSVAAWNPHVTAEKLSGMYQKRFFPEVFTEHFLQTNLPITHSGNELFWQQFKKKLHKLLLQARLQKFQPHDLKNQLCNSTSLLPDDSMQSTIKEKNLWGREEKKKRRGVWAQSEFPKISKLYSLNSDNFIVLL